MEKSMTLTHKTFMAKPGEVEQKWYLVDATDKVVGRPEIQKFYGALAGKIGKGLFVTTAKFSQKAREYAAAQHIILIDGKRLAELMIEFDVGVVTQKVYTLKRVDTDFFSDD